MDELGFVSRRDFARGERLTAADMRKLQSSLREQSEPRRDPRGNRAYEQAASCGEITVKNDTGGVVPANAAFCIFWGTGSTVTSEGTSYEQIRSNVSLNAVTVDEMGDGLLFTNGPFPILDEGWGRARVIPWHTPVQLRANSSISAGDECGILSTFQVEPDACGLTALSDVGTDNLAWFLRTPRPQVFAVMTGAGGIPGRVDATPGSGLVTILKSTGGTLVSTGRTRTAYNLSAANVAGNTYGHIKKDFYGTWLFDFEDCGTP